MDYKTYLKTEIQRLLFIETGRDITLNIKGNPVLKKGEYPVFPDSIIGLAVKEEDGIPVNSIVDAMIHLIACDPSFKYNDDYKGFLKTIPGIESFIIMNIERDKKEKTKRAVIYATTLTALNPNREYRMNRIYLLMELYEKTGLKCVEDEILKSLRDLAEDYPSYGTPNYYLGQYYLEKDMDSAKLYLRKALNDPITYNEASKLLERIKRTEEYDSAVELVKSGRGMEALKILIPYIEDNPQGLDAIYYAAVAYRQIGNYEKALLYLNELLQYGERPEVYSEIGINLAALGDFSQAIEHFRRALKITPDDSGIICNIAVCHLNLGEIEEAKRAFSLATRINPKDEIAKEWLEKLKEV
ncbi:tetratricopeptide repeat protein [Fonticella tunisiensis]|uniref:Tetratricopeptide repeat protein n=1 Tax=Fonticella tunisiensis TaxID=1096341 RepID=A0A4R7K4H9_9CLOT|nr:tetratricopeptide repeat protein [Fonticella tunisiensis]TDT46095.1 tetratricopeptide repeat protein [Fonticella tunisiensis]